MVKEIQLKVQPFAKLRSTALKNSKKNPNPYGNPLSISGRFIIRELAKIKHDEFLQSHFPYRTLRQRILEKFLKLTDTEQVQIQQNAECFSCLQQIALQEISDISNLISRLHITLNKCATGMPGTYEELTSFGNVGETLPRLTTNETAEVTAKLESLKKALPQIEQEYADLIKLIEIYYSASLIPRDTRNKRLHGYVKELNLSKGAVLEHLNKLEKKICPSVFGQETIIANQPDQTTENINKATSTIQSLLKELPTLAEKLESQFKFTQFIPELSPQIVKSQTSAAVQESSLEHLLEQFDLIREKVIKLSDLEAGKKELKEQVQTLKALLNLQESALQSSNSNTKLSGAHLQEKLNKIDDFLLEQSQNEHHEETKAQIEQIHTLWVDTVVNNFLQSSNDDKDKISPLLDIQWLENSIEKLEVNNNSSRELTDKLTETQVAIISYNSLEQAWKKGINDSAFQATLSNYLRWTS